MSPALRARPAAFALAALCACAGGSGGDPATVTVAIDPLQATLAPGESRQFTAQVAGSSDTSVMWSVQEGAAGGTVVAGLYTAPGDTGTFHVVATSAADATRSATAEVLVQQPGGGGGGGATLSGNVSGTLLASVGTYDVTGNLTVLPGTTLTIQPGVTLNFRGRYFLAVFGQLDARGTAQAPITFTTADHATGWGGLRLVPGCVAGSNCTYSGTDVDQYLQYAVIEWAKKLDTYNAVGTGQYGDRRGAGLYVEGGTRLHIDHNTFRYNTSLGDHTGGWMLSEAGSGQTFTGNVFIGNSSKYSGGGFEANHMNATTLVGGSFQSNTATMDDPGYPTAGVGGALFCEGGAVTNPNFHLQGVSFGTGGTANSPDDVAYLTPASGDPCYVSIQ